MTEMLAEVCYDPDTGRGDPVKLQVALQLTFYQIRNILCAERDPKGALIVESKPEGKVVTAEELFKNAWIKRGLPRWRIDKNWQEEAAKSEEVTNGEYE